MGLPKKLKKLDKAVTDAVLEHPELEPVATPLMEAALRAYGLDPDEVKAEAQNSMLTAGTTRSIADWY